MGRKRFFRSFFFSCSAFIWRKYACVSVLVFGTNLVYCYMLFSYKLKSKKKNLPIGREICVTSVCTVYKVHAESYDGNQTKNRMRPLRGNKRADVSQSVSAIWRKQFKLILSVWKAPHIRLFAIEFTFAHGPILPFISGQLPCLHGTKCCNEIHIDSFGMQGNKEYLMQPSVPPAIIIYAKLSTYTMHL